MARRLQIFGVHVHVGIRSAEKAVAIANALAGYIPHLLALSASSPYWEGDDTGLASCRAKVFEGLPTAGLPPTLDDWAEFEQLRGHPGDVAGHQHHPGGLVGHPPPPRLRHRRAADVRRDAHPDRGGGGRRHGPDRLVAWLDHLLDKGYQLPRQRDWVLRQNKWRAGRHGLDASLIVDDQGSQQPLRDGVIETLEELSPIANRLRCADELDGVRDILRVGPSYARQRAAAMAGCPDRSANDRPDLGAVVEQLIDELATGTPQQVDP